MQLSSSSWKAIKMFVQLKFGSNVLAELFGFVQAVYSAAVGLAGFLPSVLQLIKASQGTLMAVALVMATWGLLQSLYLWKRNFSDHGRVKALRE
ncbi:unnamed protein product [Closterium sp. NIES-64]|nr:unnamed protein product [Closterium sp. NIES-64]